MNPKILEYDDMYDNIMEHIKEKYKGMVVKDIIPELNDEYEIVVSHASGSYIQEESISEFVELYITTMVIAIIYNRYGSLALHRDLRIEAQLIRTLINNDKKIYEGINARRIGKG